MNKTYNRGFINDLNTQNISAGIITGTLGIVGAPIIVIEAAAAGGFTHIETLSHGFTPCSSLVPYSA